MMSFSTTQEMGRPVEILDEGVSLTSNVGSIDFVGVGVSATGNPDVTVTIAGGIGSSGIITITGTVDDSNNSFTSASEPTVLVINGGTYKKTGGSITWTYSAGTITLSSPVGVGGTIYGLA